jgi:hypothetical protein
LFTLLLIVIVIGGIIGGIVGGIHFKKKRKRKGTGIADAVATVPETEPVPVTTETPADPTSIYGSPGYDSGVEAYPHYESWDTGSTEQQDFWSGEERKGDRRVSLTSLEELDDYDN